MFPSNQPVALRSMQFLADSRGRWRSFEAHWFARVGDPTKDARDRIITTATAMIADVAEQIGKKTCYFSLPPLLSYSFSLFLYRRTCNYIRYTLVHRHKWQQLFTTNVRIRLKCRNVCLYITYIIRVCVCVCSTRFIRYYTRVEEWI